MPSLREYAERCRKLALTARSKAMREHLLALAGQMERDAAQFDRRGAMESDRQAGAE